MGVTIGRFDVTGRARARMDLGQCGCSTGVNVLLTWLLNRIGPLSFCFIKMYIFSYNYILELAFYNTF